jgi:hypothetical protein
MLFYIDAVKSLWLSDYLLTSFAMLLSCRLFYGEGGI